MDFKERVKNILIEEAQNYKTIFLDYDYLLCSEIFVNSPYYIIIAKDWNFLHLTGVHPLNFSATDFFIKCLDKTLGTNDFDFNKVETIKVVKPNGEIAVKQKTIDYKGTVRQKVKAIPFFTSMFDRDLVVQENLAHNRVVCTIASTDCNMTIGFIGKRVLRPKSLMKGDKIDWSKAEPVDLILRRPHEADLFTDIIYGDPKALAKYEPQIKDIVDSNLFG